MRQISLALITGTLILSACDATKPRPKVGAFSREADLNSGFMDTTSTARHAGDSNQTPVKSIHHSAATTGAAAASAAMAGAVSTQHASRGHASPKHSTSKGAGASSTQASTPAIKYDENFIAPDEPEKDEWIVEEVQEEQERPRNYSKTYNELQISDDEDDYPFVRSTDGLTYDQWQTKVESR